MTSRSFTSRWRLCVAPAAALVALAALAPADAATAKDKKTEAAKPAPAKPSLVGTFGDWGVFVSQAGRGKICYVLAQPKTREPAGPKRDAGYAFISDRPAEGVRNEVSFIMGFEVAAPSAAAGTKDDKPDPKAKAKPKVAAAPKGGVAPTATVGDETFDLLPKGANLWVKNAAREGALIAQMKAGVTLEVKAASTKGSATTDHYSLEGFSQAMDRLTKECPGRG